MPQAVSLATVIGATIDRAIATLPRLDRFRLLWGGSLALTRQALDRIDASASLAHTLSDDFTFASRAAAPQLRVVTRRALRVPAPLDGTPPALLRFCRRPYQLCPIYR